MKKFLLCLFCCAALCALPSFAAHLGLRGCWVSTVYNLDYPSAPGLSADELAAEADAIVTRARADGMNALFLQVRPCADALYPSAIFPWSAYLTGEQGRAPDGGFDPLAYFLKKCHENGIALHAWINPYRLTRRAAGTVDEALAQLAPDHPARALRDCLILAADGCLYLDPGRPESRRLIEDGIRELLENYDLDGIHFDDYFYPAGEFDDSATVAVYGAGYADAAAFRRAAVDTLIAETHALCGRLRPAALFGVSPFGIWGNASSLAGGSDTAGGSSYLDHSADSRKWVREELVDYIMPQLYWSIGNSEGEFRALLDWWSETVRGTRVRLYVGLAAYRSVDAAAGTVWSGGDELGRQLDLLAGDARVSGAALFRWGSVCAVPAVEQAAAQRFCAQRDQYRLPRAAVTVGLTPLTPERACYTAAGSALTLSCAAAPGSKVAVFCAGVRTALTEQLDGTFRGALVPAAPEDGAVFRSSALLCTAERDDFVFVRLYGFAVTAVTTGAPAALTDVSGTDDGDSHLVRFRTGTPCAASLDLSGDALRVTLAPVKTAALFEDGYFSDIRLACGDGVCTYTLGLPDSGSLYDCRIEWRSDGVAVRIRKNGQ